MQNVKLGKLNFTFCILHFAFACIFNAWKLPGHSLLGKLVLQFMQPSPHLPLTPVSSLIARHLPLQPLMTCASLGSLTRHSLSSARYLVICWRSFMESNL